MQKKRRRPRTASLDYEIQYTAAGKLAIFGFDEAGRGAWAGPVAAAAVCLPPPDDSLYDHLAGVRDSKQITARQRELFADEIRTVARAWGVGSASQAEIDSMGIIPATKLAMDRALTHALETAAASITPDLLLLDAMSWPEAPVTCKQVHIVHGDQLSLTIAAASVLAKTWRDAHMRDLDAAYPGYAFGQHKGYGTAGHREALNRLGVSPEHRRCYQPVAEIVAASERNVYPLDQQAGPADADENNRHDRE
ncbi:MAG: ribonuclease HII [Chloroflexota bacterium]